MKIQTSQLAGAALDWAVIQAECGAANTLAFIGGDRSRVSESWATCGPIIEREGIELTMPRLITRDKWCATRIEGSSVCEDYGPTPLLAAMRCYVQSRLGNEVDVPEELTGD